MRPGGRVRLAPLAAVVLAAALFSGCATQGPAQGQAQGAATSTVTAEPAGSGFTAPGRTPTDPFEGWNRQVFGFNEVLDAHVLQPVASTYERVVPQLVRRGVTNVFGNFADAWSMVNALLQGKLDAGLTDMMRVAINTTFGMGGLFDIATEMRLSAHNEDFGQTLGYWGLGPGPYVVWPLLGPSTARDSLALPLDLTAGPNLLVDKDVARVGILTLETVNTRANLLGASRVLDDVALDKYSFIRDAYLARRLNLVYDGDPPDDGGDDYPYDEERYDEPEPPPAASGVSEPAGSEPRVPPPAASAVDSR